MRPLGAAVPRPPLEGPHYSLPEVAMSGKTSLKAIVIIALASIFALFVLQNTEVVEMRLLFWKLSVSRVLMLVGSLAVGCLIGLLIGLEKSGKGKPRL